MQLSRPTQLTAQPLFTREQKRASAPIHCLQNSTIGVYCRIIWLTIFIACLLAQSQGLAQGYIDFDNPEYPLITNNLKGTTGKIATLGYFFGLYIGTTAASAQMSTTPVLVVRNDGFPGQIGVGNQVVHGYPEDTYFYFQVKAWSLAGGPISYETALLNDPTGYFGVSQIGTLYFSTPDGSTPPVIGTSPGSVPGFVLTPIPEPSTLALGALAVAGCVGCLWRGRQRAGAK